MSDWQDDTKPRAVERPTFDQAHGETTHETVTVKGRRPSHKSWILGGAALTLLLAAGVGACGILWNLLYPALPPMETTPPTASVEADASTSTISPPAPDASPTIEIRNGSGIPGLGTETAAYLEGNGFEVNFGGNADRLDYERTFIYVRSGHWVTAYSIAALLDLPQSAVLESSTDQGRVDVLIVLGLDAKKPALSAEPSGKIVFTCQIYKDRKRNQICLMQADGSDQRRLTVADDADHFYASVAPDGQSVVFSSNMSGDYEIYEMGFSGSLERLTSIGESYAPEISPGGERIVFAHTGTTYPGVWVMNRDGTNPHPVTDFESWGAWDPVWSPDGDQILFASDQLGAVELFKIRPDGSDLAQVTRTHAIFGEERRIRGRNAWSPDGTMIASYIGQHWDWDLFMVDQNGANLQLLTSGGNSLAPSFSPDGRWITYTSYEHNPDVSWACEIYIMRVDGSETRRLTDNDYCDWQPRWGP